jgi:hypothetical protein
MLDANANEVLSRILVATECGRLVWQEDADGWFSAQIGSHNEKILIRRMFIEATNQIGADPYFVQFSMPGWNTRFAITGDSDGWRAISKILNAAFPEGWDSGARGAIAYLDLQLPQPASSTENR